jgi:hypothetical protein
MGFRSFPKSSPTPPPLDSASSSSSSSSILSSPSLESWLNPSLFSVNGTKNLVGFVGFCRGKKGSSDCCVGKPRRFLELSELEAGVVQREGKPRRFRERRRRRLQERKKKKSKNEK